jgi:hypothetical protein
MEMFERFRRPGGARHDQAEGGVATADRPPQPGVTTPQPPARAPRASAREPATAAATDGRAHQYEQFGGVRWGAAFFGWLVAVGLSVILIALVSAAGAAIGLSSSPAAQREAAGTVGLIGGILLLAILMVAYYCGGYVAGRMSRFDGGRQGAAVWIIGLVVTLALAIAGAILGSQFNVLSQLNLPRIPIDEGTLTTGGLITLAAVLVGTLLAAATGGKAGHRYHRKVDRAALP